MCGKLEKCENTYGSFICNRKPTDNYPFDGSKYTLITEGAPFEELLFPLESNAVHYKFDVPCAKAYKVQLYSGVNNAYGTDDDKTRFGLNWEGKPEDFVVEETDESQDNNGSKSGALDDLLLNQEIFASWITLSFAGFEETPSAELIFPPIRLNIETGKVIKQ